MEVLSHFWSQAQDPEGHFIAIDYNSLYPSVSMDRVFPLGEPTTLIKERDLAKIHFREGLAYFGDQRVEGFIQLTILPEKQKYLPFLQYRRVHSTLFKCFVQ